MSSDDYAAEAARHRRIAEEYRTLSSWTTEYVEPISSWQMIMSCWRTTRIGWPAISKSRIEVGEHALPCSTRTA
jgi:hypothetical protein